MDAELLIDERHILAEDVFVDLVVWRLPHPARGSSHLYKYRLALVVRSACVLRYDNEPGKGDHRHIGRHEEHYGFTTPETLLEDFWTEVDAWMHARR